MLIYQKRFRILVNCLIAYPFLSLYKLIACLFEGTDLTDT